MRRTLIGAMILGCVISIRAQQPVATNLPTLTQLRQVRALTAEEAAKHYPFHGTALATLVGGANFVQDETESVYLPNSSNPVSWQAGDLLEIEATTGPGLFNPVLEGARVRVISHNNPMPTPLRISLQQMASGKADGAWAEIEGVVQSITELSGQWLLELGSEGFSVPVILVRSKGMDSLISTLLDREIQVRGVVGISSRRGSPRISAQLLTQKTEFISVLSGPIADNEVLRTLNIAAIKADALTNRMPHRIAVIGKLVSTTNSGCVIENEKQELQLQGTARNLVDSNPDEWVEGSGFPTCVEDKVLLKNSTFRRVSLIRKASQEPTTSESALTANDFAPILTTVKKVKELSPTEAAKGYPVLLNGVVTLADRNSWLLFIHDEDKGIFVYPDEWPDVALAPGLQVEVRGFSDPGSFAPLVTDAQIRVVSFNPVLPSPQKASLQVVQRGQYDSQWITISGLVRSAENDGTNRLILEIVDPRRSLTRVLVFNADDSDAFETFPGREVSITGVCHATVDHQRQLAVQLLVPDPKFIMPISSETDTFERSVLSVSEAIELAQAGSSELIHLHGIVTSQWLEQSKQRVFIRDTTGNIMIETRTNTVLKPGVEVDAVGFAELETTVPVLRLAELRCGSQNASPQPTTLRSLRNWDRHTQQSVLVKMEATLLFLRVEKDGQIRLILQLEDEILQARTRNISPMLMAQIKKPGSLLGLTGILMSNGDSPGFLSDSVLFLRSPEDVVLLRPPTWWTTGKITSVAGVAGAAFLAGLLWVSALRQRVRIQTEMIRKEVEAESALEKRYHLVWETSGDGMRMIDGQGVVVQVNEAYCRMVGRKREDLVGHPFSIIYAENDQANILARYQKDFASRQIPSLLIQDRTLWNNHKGSFELANSLYEQPGSPTLLLSLIRDVTDRKHLEEQLRMAQKMEAVGRLAGGVAHDFNNILTVIQGYTGLCKQDLRIPPDLRELMEEVDTSAKRAADLTRQLLAFSRRQPLSIQSVDLVEVVKNMTRLLERLLGEDITIQLDSKPPVKRIRADMGMMEQIVMNLTVNARDAMAGGGKLFISVEVQEISPAQAETLSEGRPGQFVCLSVRDTGCGMDEATMARIYEPFFTTKDVGKGTGLGLSTVYGIVKQHHGWVEVSSQVGKGTTFRVFLPT